MDKTTYEVWYIGCVVSRHRTLDAAIKTITPARFPDSDDMHYPTVRMRVISGNHRTLTQVYPTRGECMTY